MTSSEKETLFNLVDDYAYKSQLTDNCTPKGNTSEYKTKYNDYISAKEAVCSFVSNLKNQF